ncbi:hypothetical protein MJO28_008864 [Puccinia striiformis f. sp. tritici]|uniref:Uncharacterized protein n=1 Tax=Puccinia striiformis f. sp. tritici TaxID=168172 RepID=A0ACC0ED05_9BASI|nr:hypothetical protein MJO28_008864 [Puccinia striiformis f. sp. tritici]
MPAKQKLDYIERAGPTGPVYHCIVCMGAGWARSWKRHCETASHRVQITRQEEAERLAPSPSVVNDMPLNENMDNNEQDLGDTAQEQGEDGLHKTRVWERIYVFMRLHDEVQPDTNVFCTLDDDLDELEATLAHLNSASTDGWATRRLWQQVLKSELRASESAGEHRMGQDRPIIRTDTPWYPFESKLVIFCFPPKSQTLYEIDDLMVSLIIGHAHSMLSRLLYAKIQAILMLADMYLPAWATVRESCTGILDLLRCKVRSSVLPPIIQKLTGTTGYLLGRLEGGSFMMPRPARKWAQTRKRSRALLLIATRKSYKQFTIRCKKYGIKDSITMNLLDAAKKSAVVQGRINTWAKERSHKPFNPILELKAANPLQPDQYPFKTAMALGKSNQIVTPTEVEELDTTTTISQIAQVQINKQDCVHQGVGQSGRSEQVIGWVDSVWEVKRNGQTPRYFCCVFVCKLGLVDTYYNMRQLERTAHVCVLNARWIQGCMNVQHNCHMGKCPVKLTKTTLMEQQETTVKTLQVEHVDHAHYVINSASLHEPQLHQMVSGLAVGNPNEEQWASAIANGFAVWLESGQNITSDEEPRDVGFEAESEDEDADGETDDGEDWACMVDNIDAADEDLGGEGGPGMVVDENETDANNEGGSDPDAEGVTDDGEEYDWDVVGQ